MSFEVLTFIILNGLLYGMFLFMLSSGLTLIFGMMGILNFAHASFFMIGAYLGYQISYYTNFWIALLLAPVLVGYLGVIVEKYGLRNIHKYGHIAELLVYFRIILYNRRNGTIDLGKNTCSV